ncbi:hypothetical protein C8J56DRAFT_1049983 [Mycena floridula]|nr:hypothetical protein C8J56DRAFT_1049983 [Mycena floridula]
MPSLASDLQEIALNPKLELDAQIEFQLQVFDKATLERQHRALDPGVRKIVKAKLLEMSQSKLDASIQKAIKGLGKTELENVRLSAEELDEEMEAVQEKRAAMGHPSLNAAGRLVLRHRLVKKRQAEVDAEIQDTVNRLRGTENTERLDAELEEDVKVLEKNQGRPFDAESRALVKAQLAKEQQDRLNANIALAKTSEMLKLLEMEDDEKQMDKHGEANQRIDALSKELFAFAVACVRM